MYSINRCYILIYEMNNHHQFTWLVILYTACYKFILIYELVYNAIESVSILVFVACS